MTKKRSNPKKQCKGFLVDGKHDKVCYCYLEKQSSRLTEEDREKLGKLIAGLGLKHDIEGYKPTNWDDVYNFIEKLLAAKSREADEAVKKERERWIKKLRKYFCKTHNGSHCCDNFYQLWEKEKILNQK